MGKTNLTEPPKRSRSPVASLLYSCCWKLVALKANRVAGPFCPKLSTRRAQAMALLVPLVEMLGCAPGKPKLRGSVVVTGVALITPLVIRNAFMGELVPQ